MSDIATRRRAISSPFGCRTLSEIPRLPGFLLLNCPPMSGSVTPGSGAVALSRAARPPTGAIAAIRVSGWLFSSTLMLSAPNAARKRVPPAEARNHVKSRMRIPFSGNGLPRGESCSLTGGLAAADGPRRPRREPLARRVTEGAADLGVLDVGTALAREPVRIERVLVGLAQ